MPFCSAASLQYHAWYIDMMFSPVYCHLCDQFKLFLLMLNAKQKNSFPQSKLEGGDCPATLAGCMMRNSLPPIGSILGHITFMEIDLKSFLPSFFFHWFKGSYQLPAKVCAQVLVKD